MKWQRLMPVVLSLGLALVLVFVLGWVVMAQGPLRAPRPRQGESPSPLPPLTGNWDGALSFAQSHSRDVLGDVAVRTTAVDLGEPGLSFRYVETFGLTEHAYIADVQHINRPSGLFTDGSDNLYVVEEWGSRMLKYRISDGANLLGIGTAGLQNRAEYSFDHPTDVTSDGSGHIWVVDRNRAVQYDSGGNFLQELPPDDPWNSGDDDTHFNTPGGIAFDSAGRMYVSDSNNHRVQIYAFVGDTPVYSTTIGVTGVPGSDNAHFEWPQRIAFDSSDQLYVADSGNFRIQRCIYAAGWSCTTFHGTGSEGGGPDELAWAFGLATDSSNNIYIADGGNGRVKKCDSSGSCTIFATGFGWVPDVAADSDGDVYVSDWDDCTIQKYDTSGTHLGALKGISGVPYLTDENHLNAPFGLAVDASGNLYVSTDCGYRVLKLDGTGATQWTLGTPGVFGSDNVHFGDSWYGPDGVAVDRSGNIYVADTGNHRIQIYDSGGSYVTTLGGYGSGNYEFDRPGGVAVDNGGNIYVADNYNHRVQIYNSSRVYVATLGVTNVCGSDNNHFCHPWGVTVDDNGDVYVADADNNRIQVFDSSRVYQRTIGSGGGCGEGFDSFCEPRDVAVDAQNRVYVADIYNQRVQVFDATGAFLTTIGGQWGANTGQLRHAAAVEVDAEGNVFVADSINHRIQKFARGVPGWRQVNINGFGDRWTHWISALEVFNGQLYAAAGNWGSGARIWRSADGSAWEAVTEPGFGSAYTNTNPIVGDMIVFGGQLYAGTGWGGALGQLWRSSNDSTWQPVTTDGFGDSGNNAVTHLATFGNMLYAGTGNDGGAQIWRSATGNSGSWVQVVTDGLGSGDANQVTGFAVFQGALYAAIETTQGGDAQVWRTADGTDWTPVVTDGFGDADNTLTGGFAELGGFLYLGTRNDNTGGQIWRSNNGTAWTQAMSGGFGDINNYKVESLFAFGGKLYAATQNGMTGLEVWKSGDGLTWQQINPDGFGDSNNMFTLWSVGTVAWDNRLYIATYNGANGGEVWMMLRRTYLPLVLRNH